jgi:hypothetical protein
MIRSGIREEVVDLLQNLINVDVGLLAISEHAVADTSMLRDIWMKNQCDESDDRGLLWEGICHVNEQDKCALLIRGRRWSFHHNLPERHILFIDEHIHTGMRIGNHKSHFIEVQLSRRDIRSIRSRDDGGLEVWRT